MKTLAYLTLLIVALMFSSLTTHAQLDPEKVCRIDNGQLIFTLNLKWTEKEKKEISMLFDLDSALIAQVYSGKTAITIGNENWKAKKLQANLIELSKAVQTKADKNIKANDLFLVIDSWTNFPGNTTESTAIYGVNTFEGSNAFVYSSKPAKFYCPG